MALNLAQSLPLRSALALALLLSASGVTAALLERWRKRRGKAELYGPYGGMAGMLQCVCHMGPAPTRISH